MDHDLLTCEEAATYLRLHPRTICRLLQRGELPGIKVGRQWRIRRDDLEARLRGEGHAGNRLPVGRGVAAD